MVPQSYVHGLFVGRFDAAAVALHSSRGYETPFSKQLMRGTVLLSDLLRKLPTHPCVQTCELRHYVHHAHLVTRYLLVLP